ncbi:MAG: MG2 domain-containing protein [Myxococcaceae bacterium]
MRKLTLAALLVMVSACTCGEKKPTAPVVTNPEGNPNANLPRDLKPLPDAPKLEISQEQLPGADGKLAVVTARPNGQVKGEVRPSVTFSKPVKSLAMVEDQRKEDREHPIGKIEPAIDGEWKWLGSASAEFVPAKQVPYSTEFKVTIFHGLKSIDGATLDEDYTFTFSTPTLEVQDVSPTRNYRWMKPDDTISLLFNQPVKNEDLLANTALTVDGQPMKLAIVSRASIAEERRDAEEKAREAAKKEGRFYARQDFDEKGFKNQQTRYVLKPEQALPLDKPIVLTIKKELHGEQGPLPMPADLTLSWRTYGPLKITQGKMCPNGYDRCPYGPLIIYSSNKIDPESVKTRIKITPAVELNWDEVQSYAPNHYYGENDMPSLTLPGKFKPGTKYSVQLAAGVTDEFKQTTSAFGAKTSTDDLNPSLVTGGSPALIELASGSKLPIEVANVQNLEVSLWKLSLSEMAKLQSQRYYDRNPAVTRAADWTGTEELKYPKNQARVHGLSLDPVLDDKKRGLVMIDVDSPELEYHNEGHIVAQVTDLAAHLKVGPKKSVVWVTRMSDGNGVVDANLSIWDVNGNQIWTGKTDANGLADLPGAVDLKLGSETKYNWEYPYLMLAAEKDGDVSVTANTWSSGVEPYEFGITQGWEGTSPEPVGFVFTDRGIYRPGDDVFFKGVTRYRKVGDLKAPKAGTQFSYTVTDSRGDKVTNGTVTASKYGTFDGKIAIPKEAALGYFQIELTAKVDGKSLDFNGGFRVEEYRAPQFKVDVEAEKKQLVSGEALNAKSFARYLFGGAMANAKVRWSSQREATTFTTAEAPDFTFAQETWWWDDNQPQPENGFFASGEGQSDVNGTLAIQAGNTETPGGKPYTYTVESEVEDVNRQRVAGRATVTVHPSSFYVGLRGPIGFGQTNTDVKIDTLVVNVDGKKTAGRKADVDVVLRSWKSVRKKDASGGFSTISEPVEEKVATCNVTSADTSVPCNFKPTRPGFYIARASVKDDQNRQHQSSVGLYITGPGWVPWQRNDTDRIELLTDKTSYNVGEVAHVLIKSPYPAAKALLTVEREGVLERRPMDLKGSAITADIPITESMVPNVYASIIIMRPRVKEGGIESGEDPGRPSARIGLVKLNVEKKTKRLAVAVKTDKTDYQPGQTVTANVNVTDAAGKGTQAEIALYVVDEAVLRLTDYKTPDPIDLMFPERPLSVRIGEPLLHLVRRRSFGEKGEEQGGGGGGSEGKGFRSNFKTTVLFTPAQETDSNGATTITFKLPDNLTEFRVMAVAITQGDLFGSGETGFKVNKPILALPALPRFARVGDVFEAGVVVHAYGAGSGEATVNAEVQGARLLGPAEQKIQIAEGSPKEVRFQFTADVAGTATFRFKVKKGADEDGVQEKIPVELPTLMETVATYGDTRDQSVEGIVPPHDVQPGMGGLQLTLASTSLGNFNEGMQQLVEYPYGCLEQQSSRLIPFVALREVAGQFGMPWPQADQKKLDQLAEENAWFKTYLFDPLDVTSEKDPDKVIQATVSSISKLQNGDGSFRYWSSSYCSDSWTSSYATLALSRAKDVGFDVDPEMLQRAQGFVEKVAGGSCSPCELVCPEETQVFAAYVLARSHRPKASTYERFFNDRKSLPLFSQAVLADAMFIGGGDRTKAKTLLTEILNNAKESAKGIHFEEVHGQTYATLFHSDTRTTGVVLETLTDIAPDHPYVGKIAHYLTEVRQGDGKWRSTQEAAFSLMALTEVLRTKEKDTPDFNATVKMGDTPLVTEAFKGRSMEVKAKSVSIDDILKASGKQQLAFKKDGTGVLYYSATMKYVPKQMPMTPLDQGLFVQRWFEPYTGGGQTTKFYAGDLVRIRVRIATNQERHWAAFEVPLPAGLEPVDTSLATTASVKRNPDEEGPAHDYNYDSDEDQAAGSADEEEGDRADVWAYTFWSPFNHIETRDSKVVIFADHLPPGIHVTSFVARATTPGKFLLKPAHGELMYEPEVFGRSEGGTFEIVLPENVAAK